MNFKIAFVGAALMAFGGLFAVGCGGNACEDAATAISDKLAGCPNPPTATTTTSTGAETECTDALGTIATCQAAAFTAASCDCIGGGDATKCTADQSAAFLKDLSACK
jgi:hypothetical protein